MQAPLLIKLQNNCLKKHAMLDRVKQSNRVNSSLTTDNIHEIIPLCGNTLSLFHM